MEIECQQRFEDRQRERLLRQQEEAYDGKMCAAVGYARFSPDYYQCIRDSAAYRRGQPAPPPDLSKYGSIAPNNRPSFECLTLGDGYGGGITDCTE